MPTVTIPRAKVTPASRTIGPGNVQLSFDGGVSSQNTEPSLPFSHKNTSMLRGFIAPDFTILSEILLSSVSTLGLAVATSLAFFPAVVPVPTGDANLTDKRGLSSGTVNRAVPDVPADAPGWPAEPAEPAEPAGPVGPAGPGSAGGEQGELTTMSPSGQSVPSS